MKPSIFEYPRNAAVGRVVHKNKFYKQASLTPDIKELFIRHVEQITWQFKLAPETINIKSTNAVPEIQIFTIALKTGELKSDVLRCIDLAIPLPIIFELQFDDKLQPVAAYKRQSDAAATKPILSDYFFGNWVPITSPRKPLPIVFDLEILYSHLLTPLLRFQAREGENIQQLVLRIETIRLKQKELEKCEARLQKEKHFNRKVTINAELRNLRNELEYLKNPLSTNDSTVSP